DHEDRENEGDLILAADHATSAALSFMVRHTSGLVCVGMTGERLDALDIPMMVQGGGDSMGTAFTVSVDYGPGTGTGISAAGRAERLMEATGRAEVHTDFGRATVCAYESVLDGIEHVAVVYGDVTGPQPVLVRVHSECLTGDIFASSRCDCGPQLRLAHARIA